MDTLTNWHGSSPFNLSDTLWQRLWSKLSCLLFGHLIGGERRTHCLCGKPYLELDGRLTRIRHNVRCFVSGHSYRQVGVRNGHHEYVCHDCGHPLLFRAEDDPHATQAGFKKRVRYFCNLFGHRTHKVTERQGCSEYACHCGHSFLKQEGDLEVVTHPPICLFSGHFVRFVEMRSGYAEFLCKNCGHTFDF